MSRVCAVAPAPVRASFPRHPVPAEAMLSWHTFCSACTHLKAPPTTHQKKKKEVKEIPVPEVGFIPGYTREYLPVFRIPETYIRSKGKES